MPPAPFTWILTDGDKASREPLLAVAARLPMAWQEIVLRYNALAPLASFTGGGLWHLDSSSRHSLAPPWPDWVICAGPRSGAAALGLAKLSPSTRLAQLSWPTPQPRRFDLIAVPLGEKIAYAKGNLLRTFSALQTLTQKALNLEAARWQAHTARLPRPFLMLSIGAATKVLPYEPADFKTLAAHASAEAERLGGSLLVLCSPQTGEAQEAQVKALLTAPHLFQSGRAKGDNPYLAFLGLADAIIAMGDSDALCQDAVFTHKPFYIFLPPHGRRDGGSLSHRLFQSGAAKPHTYPVRLDWQPHIIPDAAEQIVEAMLGSADKHNS